jgi:hypothetical protein
VSINRATLSGFCRGRQLRRPSPNSGAGFSVLEISLVAGLTSFLVLMVAGLWQGFGGALSDTIAQARVVSEAHLALQTLRRDLRGSLPGTELGPRDAGLLVGRLIVGDEELRLCYDGPVPNGQAEWAAPDRVIRYEVQGDQLVRIDQTTGSLFVVADHVEQFRVVGFPETTQIELSLEFRGFNRHYTWIVQQP